jgi:DNA-binding NarL/FixJ family response regulator
MAGGAPMTPSIARKVLTLFAQPFKKARTCRSLTAREHDVLALLVRGHSYKMAAAQLEIGVETLRFHIKNIYAKLHVNSKSEAVAKALQNRMRVMLELARFPGGTPANCRNKAGAIMAIAVRW